MFNWNRFKKVEDVIDQSIANALGQKKRVVETQETNNVKQTTATNFIGRRVIIRPLRA